MSCVVRTYARQTSAWCHVGIVLLIVAVAPDAHGELPELNALVVAGENEALRAALATETKTLDELGAALMAAAGVNNSEAASILLNAGAPVDHDLIMRTPLIIAVTEGGYQVAGTLLQAGANPNYMSSFDWRPLHYTMKIENSYDDLMFLLIHFGADIDAQTNLGVTPLHRAAGFCHGSAVKILVQYGANLAITEKYGRTAAQRAIEAGCPEVADLIRLQ